MVTDPIADMLTRIRNANAMRYKQVEIPASNLKIEISKMHYRAHATHLIFCYIRSFLKVFGDIFLRRLAENR